MIVVFMLKFWDLSVMVIILEGEVFKGLLGYEGYDWINRILRVGYLKERGLVCSSCVYLFFFILLWDEKKYKIFYWIRVLSFWFFKF